MKKTLVMISLLAMLTSLLGACNTVAGIGKDMQAGGQELQKAAKDH